MNKHPWEIVYYKKQFSINTLEPSIIIKANNNLFHAGDKILDIGCGNGRNSIYLANLECMIDAFDIADLDWFGKLNSSIKGKINFTKSEINSFKWKNNYYNGVILTRVIQYLDPEEINILFANISKSLINRGFLMLNYAVKGIIQKHKEIKVPKFSHSIESIDSYLKPYFQKILISDGSDISTHTNLKGKIKSYNVIAFKSDM